MTVSKKQSDRALAIVVIWFAVLAFSAQAAQGHTPASGASAPSREVTEISDLRAVQDEVARLKADQPGKRLLIIFDIDNTLMTMPQPLGGDAWFNHHAKSIKDGKTTDFDTMQQLFVAQEMLFDIGAMVPTQDAIPELLAEVQASGAAIFLMSARGPAFYDITRTDLFANGVEFDAPPSCSLVVCDEDGEISGPEIKSLLERSLSANGEREFRSIVVRDGIMLVAGQDKGVMLQLLLAALGSNTYDHVIFVDDSVKNIAAVARSEVQQDLTIFHYTRIEAQLSQQQLAAASGAWQSIRSAICASMQSPICQHSPENDYGEGGN